MIGWVLENPLGVWALNGTPSGRPAPGLGAKAPGPVTTTSKELVGVLGSVAPTSQGPEVTPPTMVNIQLP